MKQDTGNNLLDPDYLSTMNHKDIYIVAPGPNGASHWKDIPLDAFVIFVNKAIELYADNRVTSGDYLWLVAELSAQDTGWFPMYRKLYRDRLVIGAALVDPGGMKENEFHKVFDYFGSFPLEGVCLIQDKLNSKGTVSCMATQAAYYMSPERIILCGVDMYGDTYYDGSSGFYKNMHKDRPWYSHINGFNEIIGFIQDTGVKVYTLSPTRLSIQYHTQGVTN